MKTCSQKKKLYALILIASLLFKHATLAVDVYKVFTKCCWPLRLRSIRHSALYNSRYIVKKQRVNQPESKQSKENCRFVLHSQHSWKIDDCCSSRVDLVLFLLLSFENSSGRKETELANQFERINRIHSIPAYIDCILNANKRVLSAAHSAAFSKCLNAVHSRK